LKDDNPLKVFGMRMKDAMEASGRAVLSEDYLREGLETAGCADVQSFTLRLPMGPWAKDKYESWPVIRHKTPYTSHTYKNRDLKKLGIMVMLNAEQGYHSYGIYIH
jgi:hypothetical protein